MFYKLVKNSKVVDVLSDEDIGFIKFGGFKGSPIRCGADEDPDGVVSSDGSTIYVLTEMEGYDSVTLSEIDENKYRELKEEIDASRIPDDEAEEEEKDEVDRPPTRQELMERISAIENADFQEQIDVITGAIFDIADIVFS